jgi:hypothetical protein
VLVVANNGKCLYADLPAFAHVSDAVDAAFNGKPLSILGRVEPPGKIEPLACGREPSSEKSEVAVWL